MTARARLGGGHGLRFSLMTAIMTSIFSCEYWKRFLLGFREAFTEWFSARPGSRAESRRADLAS